MQIQAEPLVEQSTAPEPAPARSRLPVPAGGRVLPWLAGSWIALTVFLAVFADLLPIKPFDVLVPNMRPARPPHFSFNEILGTDSLGRSMLSRVIYGGRQSLAIGIVATLLAMTAGLLLGVTAGYLRGRVDTVVGIGLDSMLSIPPLVFLLAITALGRRDVLTVIVGLAVVGTPSFARLARASTLSLGGREHILAAKAMGATHRRIVLRELLPDVLLPMSSFAFLFMALAIVAEASMSFLGLGVPPPTPSWGGMVNEGRRFLQTDPQLVFVPAACLVLTSLSFSVLGDRARRRFDTRHSALR